MLRKSNTLSSHRQIILKILTYFLVELRFGRRNFPCVVSKKKLEGTSQRPPEFPIWGEKKLLLTNLIFSSFLYLFSRHVEDSGIFDYNNLSVLKEFSIQDVFLSSLCQIRNGG